RLATRHRADLLFGAPRYADGHTFNSASLLRASGESGGHYDKQRLVLFAEAGPLAAPPPEAANESPHDFTAGTAPGVLQSFVPLGDAFALLCVLHIAALIVTTLTSARTPHAPQAVPTFPPDTAVETKRRAA